jgi:YD repeat-containing protein
MKFNQIANLDLSLVKKIKVFSLALGCSIALTAFSQSSVDYDARPTMKIAEGLDEIEQVDPSSGSLLIKHIDLRIPGNAGNDIVVQRTYSSQAASAGLSATHLESHNWTALGAGWSLNVAPRLFHTNNYTVQNGTFYYGWMSTFERLCSNLAFFHYSPHTFSLQLPDGTRESLYSTGGYVATSKSNWRVTCNSGVISAKSPDGKTFDFGHYSARKIGKYAGATLPPFFAGRFPRPMDGPSETYMDAIKETDANGNWIQYEYQQFGAAISPWPMPSYNSRIGATYTAASNEAPSSLLKKIVASDGRTVTFNYESFSGRLTSISDGLGNIWRYQHLSPDTVNSRILSKVILPDGTAWEYKYAPGSFLRAKSTGTIALSEANVTARKMISIKYPAGGSVSYFYEYYSQQGSIGGLYLYLRGERVRQRIRSTGETWSYAYTRGGTGQYNTTTIVGPLGTETYKFMGPSYAITSVAGYPPSSYQNNAWRVGKLIQRTYVDGSTDTYVWQNRLLYNNLYTRISELGFVHDQSVWTADLASKTTVRDGATYNATYANYDAYGNPGTIVESGPNGGSRTKTLTYLNDTTKWIIGRLKDETYPGVSTTRTFDANGNLLSINRDGVTTSLTYDSEGNVATKIMPRGLVYTYSKFKRGIAQNEVQPEGIVITRTVDEIGHITSETNGEGHTSSYTYDGLNRVTSMTTPIGNAKAFVYTANSKTATRGALTETTQYDGFGRPSSVTLGGITKSIAYDAFDRKTFESNPGANVGTSYQYDGLDRVIRITNSDDTYQTITYGAGNKTVTNERGKSTIYTYRSYGNPAEQYLMTIAAADTSANIALTRNAKDLVVTASQGGITRSYGYDSRYYLTSITNPETGVTTYERDEAGNIISRVVGASGATAYVYDGQNRLINVTYPGTTPSVTNSYNKIDKLLSANSSAGNRSYAYDANGNLTNETLMVDGISLATAYSYNENDQLISMTYPVANNVVNYVPDVLGRPTQVSGYISKIQYWSSGQIKQIDYANGTVTHYDQHMRLWPSSFRTQKDSVDYINTGYTYDGNGNLVSMADSVDRSYNRTLGYDDIDRLTSIDGPWGSGTLSYSGAGNLTSQVLGASGLHYTYDASNRLSSVSGIRATSYTYDDYGDVVTGSGSTYNYDSVPNLRCINCDNDSNKTEYAYDATNHRLSVKRAGVTSYEMYGTNGIQLIEYTPDQSNKLVEYIYLGGKRVAQRVSP